MAVITGSSNAPVELEVRHGHLVAQVTAQVLGQNEAHLVAEALGTALKGFEGKGHYFVLDLSRVSMISSLGLGMCVDTRHRAIERGMRPVMFGLSPQLLELLRMMKIDRLFTFVHGAAELERILEA